MTKGVYNKDAAQPVYLHSLISIFGIRSLASIIPIDAVLKIAGV